MKTIIIGGGKGCRSLISLTRGGILRELALKVVAVMDQDSNAPGMVYAREMGLQTTTDMDEVLHIPDLQIVIELTGLDSVLEELYKRIPHGVRVIDHIFARLFWDLVNAQKELQNQLKEKEELQHKLWRERAFLYNVFDTLPDMILVIDSHLRLSRANKSFIEFVGKTYKEVLGHYYDELLSATELSCDPQEARKGIRSVFETGKPYSVVRKTPLPNESHWDITLTPIFNRTGEIESVLAIWHRITEKVLLKREIEKATHRFESLIYSAQDMISIKDLDGRYMLVNRLTAEAFHMKPIDFIGKTVDNLLPQKIARQIKMHDREIALSNKPKTFEEILIIDGKERYFNTIRFPLQDHEGNTEGVCSIARDVTHERELQQQLVQSTKLAALGNLAAGVAHEINNPLTGILAYAEDLKEEVSEENELQSDLDVIIRETMRCRDIVRNLLDFSRQDKPEFEEIVPNRIIDQTWPLVEKLPQFRDIIMERELTEEIPAVRCDPKQIQQVLLNFMTNAADAMNGKGRIILRSEYEYSQDKCIISVEDNGPGIPENLVDKIFEPFFSTKGTNGLGLAVSWGIIERHRGTVEVDMAEEGGAIFKIVLPAVNRKTTE